jgi:tetratricopeptide (TPR) repeat protein
MKAATRHKVKFVPGITAALLVLALAVGCGSDSGTGSADPEQIVAEAWNLFSSGDFSAAESRFSDAIAVATKDAVEAEAFEGRAWSRARLGNMNGALDDFIEVLTVYALPTQDRYAGISLVYLALRDYENAAEKSNWALVVYNVPYTFSHDNSVTDTTLKLVRAMSRFHLGFYASANDDVDDLASIYGGPTVNPNSPDFVADLMEALQYYREQYGQGLN